MCKNLWAVARSHFALTALAAVAMSGAALAEENADTWRFQVTPYLWLPTIDGSLNYQPPAGSGGGPNVSVGPTDWLDLINYGALLSASATKGRVTVLTDAVYLSLTAKDERVASVDDFVSVPGTPIKVPVNVTANLDTRADMSGLVWTLAGAYAIRESADASFDLLAGVRYFGIDVATSWNLTAAVTTQGGSLLLPAAGNVDQDVDLWAGVVGARGNFRLGSGKWSALYYFDIGQGSADLTWTAMAGVTREYGWGDLVLAYRHLQYDQDANGLFQQFSFSGPGAGARFRF
jgi:hypothetical protein